MKRRSFVCHLFLLALSLQAMSQLSIDSVATRLNDLAENRPSEMIYLQTSKGIYETGEDLWFKAYLLDAQLLCLSTRSQTLYLQMCSEDDGKAVWQEKYPVEAGIVSGHVYVTEDLPEGNYFLEAFTRYSFYADSAEMSAVRKVRIQKYITAGGEVAVAESDSVQIAVMPEGGFLVAGIANRLAFKATDGHGFPVEVKGILYEDDEPLLEFESVHAGMGSVRFMPLAGKTYRMQLPDGHSFQIPDILPQGITMQLTDRDDQFLYFMASLSDDLPARTIYLMGQMRGMVCCMAQGLLKDSLKMKIPLSLFPSQGIAEITLFDALGRPVAERLVYVHSDRKLYITAESDRDVYNTRDKVSVSIKVTDEAGRPVATHLGISVFDRAYANPADPVNILTHCYLSSQIRGQIYDPAYYFNEDNLNRIQDMDLLLLTQGWRRYAWNAENLQQRGLQFITDEITGRQAISGDKFENTVQFVQVSGPKDDSELILTDFDGYFELNVDLMKSLQGGYIYLKPMVSKDEAKTEIELDDPFSSITRYRHIKENFYPTFDLSHVSREEPFRPTAIMSPDSVIMLGEVTVTAKSSRLFRDKLMGRLDSLLQMQGAWVCEHGAYQYLNDYVEGYSHHPKVGTNNGIIIETFNYNRLAPIPGKTYNIIRYEGPRKTITGMGTVVYNGPIYTEEELLRMNNMWRVKGYYGYREFYQADEVDMLSSLADYRNTLLWDPMLTTDDNGEVTVEMYNSDLNTDFTGRIEGIGGEGLLGFATFDFRVMKPVNSSK